MRPITILVTEPFREHKYTEGLEKLKDGTLEVLTTPQFREDMHEYFHGKKSHLAGFASPQQMIQFFGMADWCTSACKKAQQILNQATEVPFRLHDNNPGTVRRVYRRGLLASELMPQRPFTSHIRGVTDAANRGAIVKLAVAKQNSTAKSGFDKVILEDVYSKVLETVRSDLTDVELSRSLRDYGETVSVGRNGRSKAVQQLMKCCSDSELIPDTMHRYVQVSREGQRQSGLCEYPDAFHKHNTLLIELTDGRCYEFDPTWQQMTPKALKTPLAATKHSC